MLVHEWMTPDPQTVSTDTPVMEAMQTLREGGFRRLPVTKQGRLVGIATDRDLKEATPSGATTLSVYELNYLLSKLTVAEVMTRDPIRVKPDAPIEEAALAMEEHKISGLPVVDHDKLVGILTITDLLRAMVTFLGLREGGVRVTVDLPDEPGVLARATQAGPPSNIITAVTAKIQAGNRRSLVMRASGEAAAEFPDRLRADGHDVTDVRDA